MASNFKALPEKNMRGAPENRDMPLPLLDLSDASVKELIRSAKKRGYVTVDQINSVLPSKEANPAQIKEILSIFREMGVEEAETREAEPEEGVATREEPEGEGENDLVEVQQRPVPAKSGAKEPAERTDDPVRMYLREMSLVELLSREGEIAIAKRVEAGREAMIAGLLESPLTFQAIVIWRDELNEGKVFLRDIIDLEATYAGPDAKATPAAVIGLDGQLIVGIAVPGQPARPPQMQAPATAPAAATPFKPIGKRTDAEETTADGMVGESNLNDDDDMENWLTVAAIEAELKPKVIETFDIIAGTYKRLRRLQDQDIQFQLKRQSLSPAQERKYKKLKNEIIAEVKSLRLNQARIDALVEQLYEINKRLVGHEGRLMRLAESHGVSRDDFLKATRNHFFSHGCGLWHRRPAALESLLAVPTLEIATCVQPQGPAMKAKDAITTTDFEAFYERNEPDSAGQLACLYRSVRDVSDETLFETKEVQKGDITHHVTASSGDVLILTARSYPAFLRFVVSKNRDPELDIEEAADFECSINNPHS
jgi:hypothetical protein